MPRISQDSGRHAQGSRVGVFAMTFTCIYTRGQMYTFIACRFLSKLARTTTYICTQ